MLFSNALLELVHNEEILRAAKDFKVESDKGIKAFEKELALRKRIVENSSSHPPNSGPNKAEATLPEIQK